MRQVVLTGTYCSANKGDAAMQIAAAEELRRQCAEPLRVVLASPFADLDGPVYARHGIEVVGSQRRKLGRCLAHVLLGERRAARLRLMRTAEAEAIARADLVLDLSGDAWSDDYGPHVVLSHLYPVWLALELGRPVAIGAQTMGPLRWMGPIVRRVLDRVQVITPRDRYTQQYLQALGVRGPRIRPAADLACLLQPWASGRLDRLRAGLPEAFARGPVLGVTVSRLLGHRESLGRRARRGGALEGLASALRTMMDRHGFALLLLSHSTGPRRARDDRLVTRSLASRLGRPERVHLVEDDLDPAEAKSLIGGCDLFCAMRLHSGIAALSSGVPCVVLAYGPKAQGLMEPLGQARRVLPVSSAGGAALLEALERAWTERDAIREVLAERVPAMMDKARSGIEAIRALMQPSGDPAFP